MEAALPILLRFCACFLGFMALGLEPARAEPIDLDAQLCRGYFFVPVTMESKTSTKSEAERTLWFLYDSGASATYADPDSIERVTGKDLGTIRRIKLKDGRIGELEFNSLPTRISQLDHLSIALGREIDGILAYDTFGKRLLTLDYATESMSLEEGRLPRPNRKDIFSVVGKDKRPWLKVKIGKKRRKVLIDTGSSTTFALKYLEDFPTVLPPVPISASVRWDGIETRLGARLDANAFIGTSMIEKPIIESVPGTELLGSGILKHYRLTFDVRKKRVRMTPYSDTPIQIPPEHNWGLFLKPVRDGLEITTVLPNGPSYFADLKEGDVITHINDLPIRERNCASFAGDKTARLTRRRGEDIADVSIDLTVPLVN